MTRLPFFPEAWLYEPPDWPSLWRLAEGQAGFFTTTEARSKGIRRALLSYHTGRGTFERAGHGPYRLARWPPEPEDRIRIAWMTAGRELAVVSHESALFIHGLIDEPPAWVDLTVPRERRRRIPSREVQWGRRVLVHAPRRGLAAGEVTVARGIRAEAAERALV
ncbi:MAG: hypothetical protein KY397_03870, partial [Gemmatimonadetes bacterium]|nr:hypothetical protein [Gemmatimonadota bacterium]